MLHPTLQHYMQISDFFHNIIGDDYSILLYDLSRPYPELITAFPSNISINNEDLNKITKKALNSKTNLINESISDLQDNNIYASCMLIYQGDVLLGMLCILFDDSRYKNICHQILQLCKSNPQDINMNTCFSQNEKNLNENKTAAVHNELVARDAAAEALQSYGVCASRLTSDERLEIIKSLDNAGIFLLKGAVKDVATVLECSSASIYRYLSQLRIDALSI